MVARPRGEARGGAVGHEMLHDVAVGIEDADFRDVRGGGALLSPRFAQQRLRSEHRKGAVILAAQDRRRNFGPVSSDAHRGLLTIGWGRV